jgi:hypothetical protein
MPKTSIDIGIAMLMAETERISFFTDVANLPFRPRQ